MVGLFFESAVLRDPNGILPDQNATPFKATIADEKELVLTYSSNDPLDGFILWFVPALFVPDGQNYTPTTQRPQTAYKIVVDPSVPVNTFFTENIITSGNGAASNRNYTVQWRLLSGANRTEIEIVLSHRLTFDLTTYLQGSLLSDNVNRLINKQVNVNTNVGTNSAYDIQKTYGAYIYSEYSNELFIVEVTGGNTLVLSTTNDDIDFTDNFPGTPGASDYQIFANDDFVTPVFTGLQIGIINSDNLNFTGTGLANGITNYFNIRISSATDGFDFFYDSDESGNANVQVNTVQNYFPIDLTFYNEGTINNPVFALERNSQSVQKLSNVDNTELKFSADYAGGNVTDVVMLLIKVSGFNNNQDYETAYSLVEYTGFSLGELPADQWNAVGNILSSDVQPGQDYRIIALYYDSANDLVDAFISSVIQSLKTGGVENPDDSNFRVPDITDTIDNYNNRIVTGGVLDAAIHDRYQCEISLDKASYGGDFDDNILSVKGTIQSFTAQAEKSGANYVISNAALISIVTDDASTLTVRFSFRIQEAWRNLPQPISLFWQIFFSSQPNEIKYQQNFQVRDFEQNQASPEIINIELKDVDPPNDVLTELVNYNKAAFIVESTIDGGSTIEKQTAILNKNGVIQEHVVFTSPYLPQLQNPNMQNVDQDYVSLQANYEALLAGLNSQSCVAVIGREATPSALLGFLDYECETISTVSLPPPQNPPPPPTQPVAPPTQPPVQEFCSGQQFLSGGKGIGELLFQANYDGWGVVKFKPFTQLDKLEILKNGDTPGDRVATTYQANNSNNGEFGFDPDTGITTPNGQDITLANFDINGRRQTTAGRAIGAPVSPTPAASDAAPLWFVGAGLTVVNPNRSADFVAETGKPDPFAGNYLPGEQLVWCQVSPGDLIIIRLSGADGTAWNFETKCVKL